MTRLATIVLAALIAGCSVAVLSVAEPWSADTEQPRQIEVVDGDTIRLDGRSIRLWGIDAPESGQTCTDGSGKTYDCGRMAGGFLLRALVRAPGVICHTKDTDRYGRTVAVCANSEGDLGARLVAAGWAIDYRRYSLGAYRDQQAAAKAERLGIWSGTFVPPEEYRRSKR